MADEEEQARAIRARLRVPSYLQDADDPELWRRLMLSSGSQATRAKVAHSIGRMFEAVLGRMLEVPTAPDVYSSQVDLVHRFLDVVEGDSRLGEAFRKEINSAIFRGTVDRGAYFPRGRIPS